MTGLYLSIGAPSPVLQDCRAVSFLSQSCTFWPCAFVANPDSGWCSGCVCALGAAALERLLGLRRGSLMAHNLLDVVCSVDHEGRQSAQHPTRYEPIRLLVRNYSTGVAPPDHACRQCSLERQLRQQFAGATASTIAVKHGCSLSPIMLPSMPDYLLGMSSLQGAGWWAGPLTPDSALWLITMMVSCHVVYSTCCC